MSPNTITLDVREDIRSGREPFSRIMNAAAGLEADEQLLLIAPFEPVPLFHVMEKRGFGHQGGVTAAGDWEILFTRKPGAPANAPAIPRTEAAQKPAQVVEVDARGLEPPQPLVKILETLALLPADAEMRARTDRRPMHLYGHLETVGFVGTTEEQPDGSYLTHIHRR